VQKKNGNGGWDLLQQGMEVELESGDHFSFLTDLLPVEVLFGNTNSNKKRKVEIELEEPLPPKKIETK